MPSALTPNIFHMANIFISYAREDEMRIRPLVKAFQNSGWSVFWDRRIPSGQTWRTHIGRALSDASCVVVAWSHDSVNSNWVMEEADEGKKRGILVPVLLDNVEPPIGFRSIQAADLTNWSPETSSTSFEQLRQDISDVMGAGSPAAEAVSEKTNASDSPVATEPHLSVRFRGRLTQRRYFDFQELAKMWWRKYIRIAALAMWAVILYQNVDWKRLPELLRQSTISDAANIILVLLLIYTASLPYWEKRKMRRMWERTPHLSEEVFGTIDQFGFDWNQTNLKVKREWSKLIKYKLSDDMIIVFESPASAYYFPREFFASDGDWERVRKLVDAVFHKRKQTNKVFSCFTSSKS